jgi:hypothetical protein
LTDKHSDRSCFEACVVEGMFLEACVVEEMFLEACVVEGTFLAASLSLKNKSFFGASRDFKYRAINVIEITKINTQAMTKIIAFICLNQEFFVMYLCGSHLILSKLVFLYESSTLLIFLMNKEKLRKINIKI